MVLTFRRKGSTRRVVLFNDRWLVCKSTAKGLKLEYNLSYRNAVVEGFGESKWRFVLSVCIHVNVCVCVCARERESVCV